MTRFVSVIIPVFNGDAFLGEAIDSVLTQTFGNIELIIVNDGSVDNSESIARAAADGDNRVKYLHQAQQGVTIARNSGVAASGGDLITFLDQDDRWTSEALALQVACHAARPEIGYSIARQRCFLEPGAESPDWFRLQQLDEPAAAYLPGTLAIKRATLTRIGLFNPKYPISSDADWFARARDAGIEEYIIPQVILERRIHRKNQSQQARQIHGELFDLLHASIRRKRGSS